MKRPYVFTTFLILSALCFSFFPLHAAKVKCLKFKSEEEAASYLTRQYESGRHYYDERRWRHAAEAFEKVIRFFPSSEEAVEAAYYLAVCYFEMGEYDFANREFSNYLKAAEHPLFFENAVHYKFCIAEHFRLGKKKRPFEMRYLPKWMSAHDLALTIYDEVAAALPHHELTIRALVAKANLLKQMGEYRECVESYQVVIRRFPRAEIVPECYLAIADAYEWQSRYEFQNPDILALAELNLRKFKDDFPREERVVLAEESVGRIKEMYAKGLCDLGAFYARMHKPHAAAIYYQSAIEEFPDTHVADLCRARLARLDCAEIDLESCATPTPASQEPSAPNEASQETSLPAEGEKTLELDANPMHGCQLKRRCSPYSAAHV